MLISLKDDTSSELLVGAIHNAFRDSRFTLGEIAIIGPRRIKIREIRLVEKKKYCGNHPNECLVDIGPRGRAQGRRDFLEGTDWVDFNDRLNDVLDALSVGARVRSSEVEIRSGYCRRIAYDSHMIGRFWQWDMYGDPFHHYEDWCGKVAPASEYPSGTPGEYTRITDG